MLKQAHLEEAVRRGVINARQQEDILVIAREGDDDSAAELQDIQNIENDEDLRLVGGGNDLFVTVGILMLFSGVGFALQTWLGDNQIIRGGTHGCFDVACCRVRYTPIPYETFIHRAWSWIF